MFTEERVAEIKKMAKQSDIYTRLAEALGKI